MPVYEYECDNCSLRFEKVQRFSDEPVRICPNCGESVHRVIQPVGIIFKGSGFYVTDNRGKSSTTPPTKRDGDSKSDGEAKSGVKSETKGEAKSGETAAPQPKAVESAPSS
ncbi:MAG TPA: zinc ribbon domain-containing protein [Anaerolineae bacterium]|nr:zinc ribbon domain-containing protein [Anaerolineae bacterium]HNU03528.1 zinc ribbon domain-containing protein [Anaerolineae bacterium]